MDYINYVVVIMFIIWYRHKRTVVRVRHQLGRSDVHRDQGLRVRNVAQLRVRHPPGRHGRHVQMEWVRRQCPVGRQVRQAVCEEWKPVGGGVAGEEVGAVAGGSWRTRRRRRFVGECQRRGGIPRTDGHVRGQRTQFQNRSKSMFMYLPMTSECTTIYYYYYYANISAYIVILEVLAHGQWHNGCNYGTSK